MLLAAIAAPVIAIHAGGFERQHPAHSYHIVRGVPSDSIIGCHDPQRALAVHSVEMAGHEVSTSDAGEGCHLIWPYDDLEVMTAKDADGYQFVRVHYSDGSWYGVYLIDTPLVAW